MIPLEPGFTFHIYNHANGRENLFAEEENYLFFLKQYRIHVGSIADTFCYCLMPNHFHFLLRIKNEKEIVKTFPKFETLEKLISKKFSNFFSSYTQAFNNQQGRMGSLFMKNFKRKKVSDQQYLLKLVHYIHNNPVEADLCSKPSEWKFSSYNALTRTGDSTSLLKNEVMDWFGDRENFIYCHKFPPKDTGLEF